MPRRVPLDREYDDDFTVSQDWSGPRLAGRYAAWAHSYQDLSCKAACPPEYDPTTLTIIRANVERERFASVQGVPAGSTLRVNANGAVAWLERTGGGQREVHAWDPGGHRVLDTGPIRSASYSLRGSTLRWTNGDVAHAVTLR